jgi:peroxiredoxin
MGRRILLGRLGVVALLGAFFIQSTRAEPVLSGIAKKVPDFCLPDVSGHAVSLKNFKDKKAVVVIFLGTECVINNTYMPRLIEMQKEYAPRGVQILGINSNSQDSAERVAEHAKQYGLNFPVLKDEENVVADQFGAERTPEVFLLDQHRTIRYRGRIDDQFGIGYKRATPTKRELAAALDELLAGKSITQPTSQVAGCIIGRVSKPKSEGAITYAMQVSRIVQAKCQECHRPGDVAPMSLMSYKDVAAWSEMIREVVLDKRMPPWHADPRYGHFSNDRSLTKEEARTLVATRIVKPL